MVADLSWHILKTDLANLWRAPVLLTGARHAILIDGAFTLSAGRMQVEAVRASGRTLDAVIVTCSDPDYYFSLGPVRAAFPDVPVLAPPRIAAKIAATAPHKVATWRDQLLDKGPTRIEDVVLPAPLSGDRIELEGHRIEVVDAKQRDHAYLWLAAERAVLGGVQISSGNHVWMADAVSEEERAGWLASLDDIAARDPLVAPPGHLPPDADPGLGGIAFTRDYILAFMAERRRAPASDALIAAMRARYPDLAMEFILEMGAKVHFGEMRWP